VSGILWGNNLSLRRLLASSVGALIALILILFSAALYKIVEDEFWQAGLSHLEDHVHAVLLDSGPLYRRPRGVVPKRIVKPIPLPSDWDESSTDYIDRLSGQLRRVLIWDVNGHLLFRDSGPPHKVAFPDGPLASIQTGLAAWSQGQPDGTRLRASYLDASKPDEPCQTLLIPLSKEDHLYGYLEISAQWRSQEYALRNLVRAIGAFDLAALAVAWLAGFVLASKLAQPLEYLHKVCLRVASGDLSARAHLGHDRNEIYQVAETFDVMVSRLEQSFMEQRRFVADASHELKTPVTALIGLNEMLKTLTVEGPADRCQRTLTRMEMELDRMRRLISDLLELSQLERVSAPRTDAIQICELLQESVSTVGVAFPQHRMRILEGAAQTWILGDSHALRRVFVNLLENAVRYSPPDSEVTLSCEADPEHLRVVIRDDGCGIASQHLPFIFERFYRVDPSRARFSGGTGLGLAIVKAIVEDHGGQIDIASVEGQGTTVTVLLPLPNRAPTAAE
jgi:signal transduction histidine kinase